MRDEITYVFPNFNGVSVEVWEWINNFLSQFAGHVTVCACGICVKSVGSAWTNFKCQILIEFRTELGSETAEPSSVEEFLSAFEFKTSFTGTFSCKSHFDQFRGNILHCIVQLDPSWWRHQMDCPRYWPFVRGIHRSPVNSPHKGQWHGALMFYLICV